ncbi:MAG: sirohydrochlorin chelatase [Cyanobacteria bacterium J06648_10]
MKFIAASTAYLLISHGSRDPRPQAAMDRLAELVRRQLEKMPRLEKMPGKTPLAHGETALGEAVPVGARTRKQLGDSSASHSAGNTSVLVRESLGEDASIIVETACLELAAMPLSDRIYEFAQRLIALGISELKLAPIFLMSGVHVMEDIPAEIAIAQKRLGQSIRLTVCAHLGSHPGIASVLKQRLTTIPAEGAILVAHGSRRPKGNKAIQTLTRHIKTSVAYWAVPPDIETQVIELMQQGCQKLTILPYFLFAGGITDAIMHRTEELAERFPKVQFRLLPTLGATDEVAKLAVELIQAS